MNFEIFSAAALPEAGFLFQFLLVIAFLASMGVNIVTLFNGRRSQRRTVSLEAEFVPRRDVESFIERIDRFEIKLETLRAEMHNDMLELQKTDEDRVSKVHERINVILSAVSELRGRLEAQQRQ